MAILRTAYKLFVYVILLINKNINYSCLLLLLTYNKVELNVSNFNNIKE